MGDVSETGEAGVYTVNLFGVLRVYPSGSTPPPLTNFPTKKTGSLFAYLAYTGRPEARTILADMFWGDKTERAGLQNVSQTLVALRKEFNLSTSEEKLFIANDRYIGLTRAFDTDVAQFRSHIESARQFCKTSPDRAAQSYRKALEIYGNGFLPGFGEEWAYTAQNDLCVLYDEAKAWLQQYNQAQSRLLKQPINVPTHEQITITSENTSKPMEVTHHTDTPRYDSNAQNPTRFFGRKAEITATLAFLRDDVTRIITLTGTGGSGKTRLAREVMNAFTHDPRTHPAVFTDLGHVGTVEQMESVILLSLGKPAKPGTDVYGEILTAFGDFACPVLFLDNCERVAAKAGLWLENLVRRSPNLKILLTSRVALDTENEQIIEVTPLSVPADEDAGCRDEEAVETLIARFPALQLYRYRAGTVVSGYTIGLSNLSSVIRLLQRLEGLPLAIELAAVRARTMSAEQMCCSLEDGQLATLEHNGAKFNPRHRSLRDTIRWSVDLLPAYLQQVFAQLSVFPRSFSLEAAQFIITPDAPDNSTVADYIQSLVNHSLLLCEETDATPTGQPEIRYRLLDTIRAYARERLGNEVRVTIAQRHARFYANFANDHQMSLFGAEQRKWMVVYLLEYPNFSGALNWFKENKEDSALFLTMISSLARYWMVKGPLQEGRLFSKAAIAQGRKDKNVPAILLLRGLNNAGVLAIEANDTTDAYGYLRKAHWLTRPSGPVDSVDAQRARAFLLINLALIYSRKEKNTRAKKDLYESIALLPHVRDGKLSLPSAWGNLGRLAIKDGEWEEAETALANSLALARELNHIRTEGLALGSQADLARERGNLVMADLLYRESLIPLSCLGDDWSCAISVLGLAFTAQAKGDSDRAAWLGAVAASASERLGIAFPEESEKRRRQLPTYQSDGKPVNFAKTLASLIESVST